MCCILSSLELTTWSGGPFASTLVWGSQLVTCSRGAYSHLIFLFTFQEYISSVALMLIGTYNMQKGLDAELALLPFRPMSMKVLQCAFLSGIKYGSCFSSFSLLSIILVHIQMGLLFLLQYAWSPTSNFPPPPAPPQ